MEFDELVGDKDAVRYPRCGLMDKKGRSPNIATSWTPCMSQWRRRFEYPSARALCSYELAVDRERPDHRVRGSLRDTDVGSAWSYGRRSWWRS